MSEIICPECNEEISSYAKACPHCGFPMDEYLKEHNLTDFEKVWICTKCGEAYCDNYSKRPICEYCNTPLIQTDLDNAICRKNMSNMKTEDYAKYQKEIALKYGNNFDQDSFKKRRELIHLNAEKIKKEAQVRILNQLSNSKQPSSPRVTCPYCHSTNTKKITTANRIGSTMLFGVFSKKLTKERHCNSCGSDF